MADFLGAFEQAVLLAMMKLGEEAYGRSILRGVQVAVNREVAAGAIYATLDRLEQKGLISSLLQPGSPVRDGRARRFYRVTASGVKALNEAKAALENIWQSATWPIRWPA